MADVAMGNLRFDLTADNSSFMAAVRQAKEAQTQAASEMGSKFAAASQQAQRSLTQMAEAAGAKALDLIKKLQDIGKQMQAAFQAGSEGSEKFATDSFNSIFAKAETGFQALIAKAPGWWGKIFAGLYEIGKGSGALDTGIEALKKKVAGGLDNLIGKAQTDKWSTSIRDSLVATATATSALMGGVFDQGTLDENQKRVETWADGVKKKMDEMVEGVRTALQKLAGTWDGISSDVKKFTEGLKERTDAQRFQTDMLGKDRGERTYETEKRRAMQELGKGFDELNEKSRKYLETELEASRDAAIDYEAEQKRLEQIRQREQAVQSLTAALKRQGDMAMANAGRGTGKSAFDRAIEQGNAMADGYSRGKVTGLQNDPAVIAARNEAAQKAQEAANYGYRLQQAQQLREASDRGALDVASMGARPGEIEKMRVEMDLMNKARREGVTLDANQIALNSQIAESMGKIAQATAEARERFEAFREVGRTVASSLEDAFSRFIGGTQVQWKEFIAGLQADLAKLAFRKGVESLLTGGASSGGGLAGALAGIFGGFRADGGAVSSGKSYIVGERGPEMFVPQGAGSIVSNQALMNGGAGPTTINMRVDLTGANGDETIRRISRAAAFQAASAAVQQANDAMPQRQRQLQLLGT